MVEYIFNLNKPTFFYGKLQKILIDKFQPKILFQDNSFEIGEKEIKNKTSYPKTILYNKKGNIIKEIINSSDNEFTTNFLYDSSGNLIEINMPCISTGHNCKYARRYTFKYNSINQLIKQEKTECDSYSWANYYHYNYDGLIELEEWRSDRYALIDFNYQYDSFGNLINKKGKYLHGQVELFLDIYSDYDEKNRLIIEEKEELDDWLGVIRTKRELYYGNYESLIKKEVISKLNKETIKTTARDFTYDEYGNILKLIEANVDGYSSLHKYDWVYKYDKNKNWYHSMIVQDKEPKLIIKRELNDYDEPF